MVWGRVDKAASPHFVLPFTVAPSYPVCAMMSGFLNLWIGDLPFKLDPLLDLARY